ncbi:hypothetical protein ASD56_06160 [Microbacterium sp. Root166]|uniref:sensor histidine kinase n=1 Tax=Microbacterium sp. Root166 TaxID=1736478 RepID=UPI0006FA76C1|nr:sensor histidine kinase [Microbacterium sp. Root166]KQZ85862.1 hypothetical protein ASD56_06160 [Microbacterium sp. Root166]
MTSPVRQLWGAPAASPEPPRRVWRDWPLVGLVPVLAVLEASLRPDVPWRWLWAGVLVALAPTLLWRRARPFLMFAIAFGAGTVVGIVTGGDSQLFTTAYFLVLLYALFRWGSGRALVLGSALVICGIGLSLVGSAPVLGDVIGGLAVAAMTATLGLAFRLRAGARRRELEGVRMLEREQLARDLHDTVAHHVSAIAIQAQAGTAVASTDPAAALAALRTIEGEASRTLHDMRSIVGVLRHSGDAPDLAPMPGLDDLVRLDRGGPRAPVIEVRLEGDADAVTSPVAAAVFRIAQEGVTNARRHAKLATRVELSVRIDETGAHIEVRDDGRDAASAPEGFGLAGMRERAALFGGTCEAGPGPDGGWVVTAWLPRRRWSA